MKIKSNTISEVTLTGKILVLRDNVLKEEYNTTGNRLHRATGGFGCNPSSLGRAVFATCLSDKSEARWDRSDFEGWVTEDEAKALLVKERVIG